MTMIYLDYLKNNNLIFFTSSLQVQEILESPWISKDIFPGPISPEILMQVMESLGNLNWLLFMNIYMAKFVYAKVLDFLTKYCSVYFSRCRKHTCSLNCVFFLWKSVTNPWFLVSWKLKKMIIKLLERSWKSPWICSGWPCRNPVFIPSEEFELTASSLGAHTETHGKLILRTLSCLTVNSRDDWHCELSVSLQLTW